MSLKVAIVGCGKIADAHVEEVRKVAGYGAEVVGVCDRERLMAEQLAMRFGVPAHFDRVEEMLERTRPDVVHITTPPQSHLALARVALQAGCHVYVEKPLAMNLAEAETLIGEVTAAGKKLTLGWEYLFDPPALRLRQLATDGVLGETVHVDSVFGYGLGGPFGAAVFGDPGHWVHKLPGKLLHNVLDHILNKVVEFLPDDNPSVTAFGNRLSSARYGDHRDDILDEVRILVRGRKVTGFGLFSAHARPIGHSVKVFGTKNTALVDLNARTTTLDVTTRMPSAIGRLGPAVEQTLAFGREALGNFGQFVRSEFDFFNGLRALLTRFYASIVDGAPLPIAYRDILRVTAMMDEVFRQLDAQTTRARA